MNSDSDCEGSDGMPGQEDGGQLVLHTSQQQPGAGLGDLAQAFMQMLNTQGSTAATEDDEADGPAASDPFAPQDPQAFAGMPPAIPGMYNATELGGMAMIGSTPVVGMPGASTYAQPVAQQQQQQAQDMDTFLPMPETRGPTIEEISK